MEAKMFEIRDRATFIPILAVRLDPTCNSSDPISGVCNECSRNRYLLARAGYGITPKQQREYIQLVRVDGGTGKSDCDPYEWGSRTLQVAHEYMLDHWVDLKSGDVLDVEFILGETKAPKQSEEITV